MKNIDINLLTNYYEEHPNAPLEAFVDEVKRLERIEEEKTQKIQDWYNSLVGRYFLVNNSFYMEVKSDEDGLYTKEVRLEGSNSDIYKSLNVSIIDNCEFYKYMFKNPFIPDDGDMYDMVEVTKEEFDRVLNLAEMFIKLGEERRVVKTDIEK